MFSLQKLLGHEDKFFNLLEASAKEAQNSVVALGKLIAHPEQVALAREFVEARQNERELRAQISEAVYTTFVTALEREDIESLANALYRIPKTVEKFGVRLLLTPQIIQGINLTRQIELLTQATATVMEMVQSLRRGANLDQVRQLNDKMQQIEGEADRVILDLFKELYSSKLDPVAIIARKDLHELMEKIIDRCRDAGNIIANIALKNS
jgi:uncharacterized protein Yka (UPF0111/DUF47 family)